MNKLEKKEFYKKLLKLVVPMAFQQLMGALVGVSDAVMMGFLNQDALSAVSLATQVSFVFFLFLFALTSGVSIFAAQYWGIHDKDSIEKILGIGLKATILISLPFTFGCIFIPETIMKAFASEQVLIEGGAEYLRYVALSFFLLSISQVYLTIMKNCEKAVMCAVISSSSVVINIVFNALLIFGIGPFPEMGIAGAAIATVISKLVESLWTMIIMLLPGNVKIRIKYVLKSDKVLRKDFWRYTLPIFGNQLGWGLGFTMYSVIMGHLGSDAAAANSIANIVKNLAICVCTGIASAGGVMVGALLGQGRTELAKAYGNLLVNIAIISGIIAGATILCVIPFVPMFTGLTDTAQSYLRVMLIVCSYYVIGKSINMTVVAGIFPAGGDSRFGCICDITTMWAVTVPIGLIAAFVLKLPVLWVYILINTDEIIKLPAVFWNFRRYRWLKNLTRVKEGNAGEA
ncbi:MAG: MATE family efflux transporter [Lachnospiraceae bacterium]|nr:MATE family efflux transporter [Lachnospiraceae bacterium]